MATATNVVAAPPCQLFQKEPDIQMMLAVDVHLDTKNCDFQMEHNIFKHRNDVFHVMDPNGKKFMQDDVADRIQQKIGG
ncbi:40S ribosomal protein SA isoform B [Glycine soja]|uniref:40S ribosomal protein SA isoform B n=1 Tax=Glycine soja TaxID=3848 RepID=A0A445LA69_GLYSO|nr:40S ribosomal protein SA isoform B [Glycine soja]